MISHIFRAIFFKPLYNGLVILATLLPWVDLGLLVIIFTILIKLALFPISQKASRTQLLMKQIQPELDKIKQQYTNKEEQAKKMFETYKKYKLNPLSSVVVLLIQLPIIFALYFVFSRNGFPVIHPEFLYSFVSAPQNISHMFLGFIDISQKSVVIAALAGFSQYLQARFVMPAVPKKLQEDKGKKGSFGEDFAQSMQWQMKFLMPVVIGFIAYRLNIAISLYWITSNLFATGQEIFIRRKLAKEGTKAFLEA